MAALLLQRTVTGGRNPILFQKGTVKIRVAGKSGRKRDLLHRHSFLNQGFGIDKPPLYHILVKAHPNPAPELVGDITFTDKKRSASPA